MPDLSVRAAAEMANRERLLARAKVDEEAHGAYSRFADCIRFRRKLKKRLGLDPDADDKAILREAKWVSAELDARQVALLQQAKGRAALRADLDAADAEIAQLKATAQRLNPQSQQEAIDGLERRLRDLVATLSQTSLELSEARGESRPGETEVLRRKLATTGDILRDSQRIAIAMAMKANTLDSFLERLRNLFGMPERYQGPHEQPDTALQRHIRLTEDALRASCGLPPVDDYADPDGDAPEGEERAPIRLAFIRAHLGQSLSWVEGIRAARPGATRSEWPKAAEYAARCIVTADGWLESIGRDGDAEALNLANREVEKGEY